MEHMKDTDKECEGSVFIIILTIIINNNYNAFYSEFV